MKTLFIFSFLLVSFYAQAQGNLTATRVGDRYVLYSGDTLVGRVGKKIRPKIKSSLWINVGFGHTYNNLPTYHIYGEDGGKLRRGGYLYSGSIEGNLNKIDLCIIYNKYRLGYPTLHGQMNIGDYIDEYGIRLNYLLHFNKFYPYFGANLNAVNISPSYFYNGNGISKGLQVGCKFSITKNIFASVSISASNLNVDIDRVSVITSGNNPPQYFHKTFNCDTWYMLNSLGISYRF